MNLRLATIPKCLRERPQWVLWKNIVRDGKPTKVPFSVNGEPAKANDPATWSAMTQVWTKFLAGGYAGIGYEFSADDPFCGIDLDGCRDANSGKLADWARKIILDCGSYAEVSPSGTGVKIFIRGKWEREGHKKPVADVAKIAGKEPAIEIYSSVRYFAVTGWRLQGLTEVIDGQKQLDALYKRFWPPQQSAPQDFYSDDAVVDRARKYLQRVAPAVSGSGGHNQTFQAACVLVLGFGLPENIALRLLTEWNQGCQPPWSEKDLIHKLRDADKQPGDRNYLRNSQPQRFDTVKVPYYKPPKPRREPRETTLSAAGEQYLELLSSGGEQLVSLGLSELDYAVGGGVTWHELVLVCGRPNHGKSLIGMQCIHHWTGAGMPCALILEEGSPTSMGKRLLQFASDVPTEHWEHSYKQIASDLFAHLSNRAECFIYEGCGTVEVAAETIRRSVKEKGVQCVVVDYAQLLRGAGKSSYEQQTDVAQTLRQVVNEEKIILMALCQLSRDVEKRKRFVPMPSDIKATGQWEQDADVILFGVWPYKLDKKADPFFYQMFVMKNKSRATNQDLVSLHFKPSRQMVIESKSLAAEPVTEAEMQQALAGF